MKYGREVIDLMAPFPGRGFRMQQLVRYVTGGRTLDERSSKATRKAVSRVLDQLHLCGSVEVLAASSRGAAATYRWSQQQNDNQNVEVADWKMQG